MDDLTLLAAKKLRAYENEHPLQALIGGFTPGVGQASSLAALRDPDAPWWEKGLSSLEFLPVAGGAAKAVIVGAKIADKSPALKASLMRAKELAAALRGSTDATPVTRGAKEMREFLAGDPRSNDLIHNETDWFIEPDSKQWATEIDDSMSSPDLEMIRQLRMNNPKLNAITEMKLGDSMIHPKLYKVDDTISDMTQEIDPAMSVGAGHHRGWEDTIRNGVPDESSLDSISKFRRAQLHETAHGLARRHGYNTGANFKATPGKDEVDKWRNYMGNPGEIIANVTALRRNMTPMARKKFSFHRMMDEERARIMAFKTMDDVRYADDTDLKKWMTDRGMDPEEHLVRGP